VRLYDRLFTVPNPAGMKDGSTFKDHLNPDSLIILDEARVEPSLAGSEPGKRVQFERRGYFCVDSKDSGPDGLVFNRTVTLRDSWAKLMKKEKKNK
jgi:glutaminyl-tRNA synthetase